MELFELINPLPPTINSPIIANRHPAIWRFYIVIPNKSLEKATVVMRLHPLNIIKVDPEIKLSAVYFKIEESESGAPGLKNDEILQDSYRVRETAGSIQGLKKRLLGIRLNR